MEDNFYDDYYDGGDDGHDAWVLASAGWGTDEDYGFFDTDHDEYL